MDCLVEVNHATAAAPRKQTGEWATIKEWTNCATNSIVVSFHRPWTDKTEKVNYCLLPSVMTTDWKRYNLKTLPPPFPSECMKYAD